MMERKDLTRWNRPGKTRFTYVDGNAVEYLEILRQQLFNKFEDPDTHLCDWLKPAEKIPANEEKADGEMLVQRQERLSRRRKRLLDMYHQDRRDWAWEITRTFARASHILTTSADAYANEGYLGTATQWDNVRRLVEMLGYHPAPPASAITRLALIAKDNKKGIVSRGFKVQHSPEDGGAKVVFETLEDIMVDSALNALRPKDWDKSQDPAVSPPGENGSPPPPTEEPPLSNIANEAAIHIQGVETESAEKLDTWADDEEFKIKDFPGLDLDTAGLELGGAEVWDWKDKADFLIHFAPEGDWLVVAELKLPDIVALGAAALAEQTGNSLSLAKSLLLDLDVVEACLDPGKYSDTALADLLPQAPPSLETMATSWRAKRKPIIEPGQVAMVHREVKHESTGKYLDDAAAVTIAKIEEETGIIHLRPVPGQTAWYAWKKSDVRLKASPRWERDCWLNNKDRDVIRTKKPHGLSADAYICWKRDRELVGYGLLLSSVDGSDDLPDSGSSLVIVARIEDRLHVRIFDPSGEKVIDKSEDGLFAGDALTFLKGIDFDLDGSDLSQEEQYEIIKAAATCAGYTWRCAKVVEADKRNLRLEVTGPLPQKGTEIFLPKPIDDSVMPADFEEIVLLKESGDDLSPPVEPKVPGLPKDPDLPAGTPDPIFWTNPTIPDIGPSISLPSASLEKIGSFLFPSPFLPMDLVKAAVEMLLSLGVMQIPSTEEFVIKGLPLTGFPEGGAGLTELDTAANNLFSLLNELEIKGVKMIQWDPVLDNDAKKEAALKTMLESFLERAGEEPTVMFKEIKENMEDEGVGQLLAMPDDAIPQAVVEASDPLYMFDGKPGKIEPGDWVVGEFSDRLRALKVSAINEFIDSDETETFSFSFVTGAYNKELKKVYADFRGELIAEGATVNNSPLDWEGVELEEVPESLSIGREVLLTAEGKDPVAATINDIKENTIFTDPPATGFTKGELIINGNVALAGHGKGKPAKILGSGDATKSNQEFVLEVDQVSFTPDATKSSGVAAAIDVDVAGRIWEQVSTLKDSGPGDFHYAVRMTEDGYVKIVFGDGEHGRRLPSGKNNIRVRPRVGSGLSGNVPARGLEKPVSPHRLIKSVHHPRQAAGGGEMEDVSSLRENAPSSLLALERAVSLSDFSHLAASQSSIWQAKAYRRIFHGGRAESVQVVIVPADGVSSSDIEDATRTFLQKHALPGVRVAVTPFIPDLFDLKVTVRIKTEAFVDREVAKQVTSAVKHHFTLENRELGEHLYLSEVYKIVEGVRGVENSICVLNGDKTRKLIRAKNESTVVYLDTTHEETPSTLVVKTEEYQP